ncbi:hypothetical protein [Geosporobacter ferrireducens]|uniref:PepSY domain-containing protein n=1 Tax=Geosporobacter ferrireducens TaxID=1424294 RepID=A0A1D8GEW2_9FIRM|nr:hypothetical protein [Geosporobacter ferrireducens]AOT69446.1 hypothetical protein Gferi_07595 [Geosporobacter ferrireducens]
MKKPNSKERHFKKSVLAAAMIIGANIIAFQGFTQAASAAVYNKTNIIPTSYANSTSVSSQTVQNSLPEGYKKANYKVGTINLPYYKNQTPAEKDMTKEAAAELVAQYLWQVYGANLEGQTIEMGYDAPTENTPRPMWIAEVELKGQNYADGYRVDRYGVWIDSVTGELYNIGLNRTLKEKVPVGPDWSLNESEYEAAAKKLAEKYNIVNSTVQSIQFTGQGASFSTNISSTYGDPTISFQVHGENGEVALMTISRYDKVLLGVMYNGQYKYDLLKIEELVQEMEAKAKADEATSADKSKVPTLMGN